MADLFDLKGEGYFYSRLANPTVAALENKLAALEGGIAGIGCSSGMSATLLTAATLCEAGANIVCAQAGSRDYRARFRKYRAHCPAARRRIRRR